MYCKLTTSNAENMGSYITRWLLGMGGRELEQFPFQSHYVHSDTSADVCPLDSGSQCSLLAVHVHTGRKASAPEKTWDAHKCSLQKCFLHIFRTCHSKFR